MSAAIEALMAGMSEDKCSPPCLTFIQATWVRTTCAVFWRPR